MNILLIEDDTDINQKIVKVFNEHRDKVICIYDEALAKRHIKQNGFNLYIIDLNFEEINGLEIIKYIREIDNITPIIVINGSHDLEILKEAYEKGCSEYLKKPFFIDELKLKVEKYLYNKPSSIVNFSEDFYYNVNTKQFYYKKNPIPLSLKSSKLCELLIKNINQLVDYEKIAEFVWQGKKKKDYPIRQLVSTTRKKLPLNIILTSSKMGYIIREQR